MQTVLGGVLALALLEASTSSNEAAGRVGTLLDHIAGGIAHVLSPSVPAIPDLRHKGGAATSSATDASGSSSSGSTTMPADWSTSAKSIYV